MIIKRKLTEVAVDAFAEYLQEKLEQLKQFDLDKDGVKDVEQIIGILQRSADHAKEALATTNFSQIAAGLDQIICGVTMIRESIDREKLSAFTKELSIGATKLGELAQLSIKYVKDTSEETPS